MILAAEVLKDEQVGSFLEQAYSSLLEQLAHQKLTKEQKAHAMKRFLDIPGKPALNVCCILQHATRHLHWDN